MTTTIYAVSIFDGASFDARVCGPRAFTDQRDAELWGMNRRDKLRDQRRAEGETDEQFIEAIYCRVTDMELDLMDN